MIMRANRHARYVFALLGLLSGAPAVVAAEDAAPSAPAVSANDELGADGIQRATLTLDSYSFSPAHLVMEVGKPVELILNNVSSATPHSLVIDDADAGFAVH